MNFWWVNHNKTYKQELGGGYIWSPKTKSDGTNTQGYINMTLAGAGDVIFSYGKGLVLAIGIIQRRYVEAIKPDDFGASGEQWHPDGYLVPVFWLELPQPLRPKSVIQQFQHLLPVKHSPLQQDGNGNQNIYLAGIPAAMGDMLLGIITRSNVSAVDTLLDHQEQLLEQAEEERLPETADMETTKGQLIQARVGQGIYRKRLLAIEKSCRLTGASDPDFLIASHIQPWRCSSNEERLDGNNGLLLSPHVDWLFDKGWLSFRNNGDVLWAEPMVTGPTVNFWRLNCQQAGGFNPRQQYYLDFHRDTIYAKRVSRESSRR